MKFKHFILFILLFLLVSPVNALSNYDTRFDIDYSSYNNYKDYYVDTNNTKLSDFVDVVRNNTSLIRPYTIIAYYNGGSIYDVFLLVFDTSSNYTFNLYGNNYQNFIYKFTTDNSKWGYDVRVGGNYPTSDIYQSTAYLDFITCASGGSCTNLSTFDSKNKLFKSTTTIDNNSNNTLSFDVNEEYVIYYSTYPLHISNTFDIDNNRVFYKSIYIDNEPIYVGDNFPTYFDYINTPTPEPDVPVEPDEPETDHKSFFNFVYWFDDNSTNTGILSNIYIILFLYCVSSLILKFLSIIKNTKNIKKWR